MSERRSQVARRAPTAVVAGIVLAWVASMPATAHGVPGGEATLEGIPQWLYLGSGAAVVLASFAIVGLYAGRETGAFDYRRRLVRPDLSLVATAASAISVGLYVGVILLGFLGPNDIQFNYAPPLLVEIYWWVTLGIFVTLVGNVWPAVNPWKTLFEWAGEPTLDRAYPESVGALPALLLFLVFAWLNVVVLALSSPLLVAVLALGYGLLMVGGMAVFGKEPWLHHADAFTLAFDFFGRFAPLAATEDGIEVRSYAVGLVEDTTESTDEVLLVIALLYVLSFDGFTETPTYLALLDALVPPGMDPLLADAVFGGTFLLAGYVLFVVAYAAVAAVMARVAGSDAALGDVMERFALTLVPIAVAYHIAHYSLYYALQHEQLLQVLRSPLPGTALVGDPDLVGFLTPQLVWYYTVALIVVGHVVAVWVAHHVALDYFDRPEAAVRSQLPMMALMVFYTVVSLWIVSQPFGA